MDTILAWLAGTKAAAAFASVRDFLAGKKTHITAALGIAAALAHVLTQMGDMKTLADFIAFARAGNANPDLAVLWLAALHIFQRLGAAKAEQAVAVENPK